MLDIFKIMNEIDDSEAISDKPAVRKTRKLSEDYKVSYDLLADSYTVMFDKMPGSRVYGIYISRSIKRRTNDWWL